MHLPQRGLTLMTTLFAGPSSICTAHSSLTTTYLSGGELGPQIGQIPHPPTVSSPQIPLLRAGRLAGLGSGQWIPSSSLKTVPGYSSFALQLSRPLSLSAQLPLACSALKPAQPRRRARRRRLGGFPRSHPKYRSFATLPCTASQASYLWHPINPVVGMSLLAWEIK